MLPGFEFGEELFDLFRVLGREVALLGKVVLEVVEFHAVIFEVFDEFPVSFSDDAAGRGAEVF